MFDLTGRRLFRCAHAVYRGVPAPARRRLPGRGPLPFRLRRDESRLGDLLMAQARLVVESAQHLAAALDGDQAARVESARLLQEGDYAAEAASHAVLRALTAAFVTPFDRADVYRLCWTMRKCAARMDAAGDELALFVLGDLPLGATDLVQLVVRAADVTADSIPRLGQPQTLVDPWIELTRLGKQSGQAHRRLLAEATSMTSDPVRLIQYTAVAQSLRRVVEAFEDVADALQTVAVKES
jgi:hypothetical protein